MSTPTKNETGNEKTPSLEVKNAVLDVDVEGSQNAEDGEIFRTDAEGQNYRTVSWSVLPLSSGLQADAGAGTVHSP
jgi:hypothetical protein